MTVKKEQVQKTRPDFSLRSGSAVFENETRLREILGCVPDPMCMMDSELTIVWANEPARKMFGNDLKHKKCFRVFRRKDVPCADCLILDTFRDGKSRFGEYVHLDAGNRERVFQCRTSIAEYGPDNTPCLVMETLHDITDQKKMISDLEQAKTRAESATRAKSEFLATISHEIRTPMNAILGMSRMALGSDLAPAQRRRIASIQSAGETLMTIINDILDFSRIDAGKLSIRQEPFQFGDVMEKILSLVKFSAREKNLRLVYTFTHDLPFFLTGDAPRLTQILLQLVGNALKYTEKGEVAVSSAIHTRDDQTRHLTVRVRDTGIGMAPDRLSTLFDPFTQINGSSSRDYGGIGMGLALVKRITDVMNGTIQVQSEPGKGTVFTMTLPVISGPAHGGSVPPADILAGKTGRVAGGHDRETTALKTSLSALGLRFPESDPDGNAGIPDLFVVDQNLLESQDPDVLSCMTGQGHVKGTKTAGVLVIHDPETLPLPLDRCRHLLNAGPVPLAFIERPVLPMTLVNTVVSLLGKDRSRETGSGRTREVPLLPRNIPAGKKVLIVDDDPVNREITGALVERTGAGLYEADNGQTAVEMVSKSRFDLIFMDMMMPKMDGFETTRQIRGLPVPWAAEIPVVALTGHDPSRFQDQGRAAGIDEFLTKPVRRKAFYAVMERWIGQNEPAAKGASPENKENPLVHETGLIDMEAGLSFVDHQKALYVKMLEKFVDTYHRADADIDSFLAAKNFGSIRFLLHNLASIGNMIGAGSLGDSARGLLNRMDDPAPAARARQSGIEADIKAFRSRLRQVVARARELLSAMETVDPVMEQDMTALLGLIRKHQPAETREMLARIMAKEMPQPFSAQLSAIEKLVGRYRFKEAEKKLVLLINKEMRS